MARVQKGANVKTNLKTKTERLAAGVMFLTGLFSTAEVLATEPDKSLCRGPYPIMLMTDGECRLYLDEVKVLRSKGQLRKLAILQQQHTEQLNERAVACPCMESTLKAIAPQHVVMLDPDC
jgi:hypothetical protein